MYTKEISIGGFKTGHIQGIALDRERKYMYCSFTTCLVKMDMAGNVLGTVKGLAGHLGCLAYNEEDGRVYGSLEYKHDSVGQAILERTGTQTEIRDGFYIAIFDVEKIDRMDMDAEKDGVMTAVYLSEVVQDYTAPGHRHGCSGIDGLTFAPLPGENANSKKHLYVAYGVYSDTTREDTDYQVLLRYDIAHWQRYEAPLNQQNMHTQGPDRYGSKYFVYTGNTQWGVQNLEYDPVTGFIFACVYPGEKPRFPNYPMYMIDLSRPAVTEKLQGMDLCGETLALAQVGERHLPTGICGSRFPHGSTGIIALGDGYFYFSEDYYDGSAFGSHIRLYRHDGQGDFTPA